MTTINRKLFPNAYFRDLKVGDWYLDEDGILCQKAKYANCDANCYFITEDGIDYAYEEESVKVTRVNVEINITPYQDK